jgi:hypothetical protein
MWQHPNGYYYYSKTSLGTKDKREALKREQELRRVKWLEKHKLINNQESIRHRYLWDTPVSIPPKSIFILALTIICNYL